MRKQWLVGTLLVLVGGCDLVLGIDQAPALQEDQACREWKCTEKTCDWLNFAPGTACSDSGNSECNGKGQCRLKLGVSCKNASDCSSDQCIDDVCCDSVCGGKCQTCSSGHCDNVTLGEDDEISDNPCLGPNNACDGKGECLKKSGQTCGNGSECATGFCADGVCCDSACTETCRACNTAGECTTITSGTDNSADQPCNGVRSCNGLGACKTVIGAPCSNSAECESGHCADGVCCNDDCSGTCTACNLPNMAGTCQKTPKEQLDLNAPQPCGASGDTCDGFGNCKLVNGQSCVNQADCLSGSCVDGVCCNDVCSGSCRACNSSATGLASGTCGYVIKYLDPKNQCVNGACDGAGGCKKDNGQVCGVGSECLSGNCVDGVCCNTACNGTCQACNLNSIGICSNVPFGQDDSGTCTALGQSCNGAGVCRKDNGETCSANTDCLGNVCNLNKCVGRSCDGLANCTGGNCCTFGETNGGTYNRSNTVGYPATVSSFRMDRFEVTVGRFRKFVAAYPGSKPIADAGAHSLIPGSGWNQSWTLPSTQADLTEELKTCAAPTWTVAADPVTDNRPINCVSWELAFAFCVWDGNRLPTEAEWNFVAARGSNQSVYPWSDNWISPSYAVFDCANGGDPATCTIAAIPAVGSRNAPDYWWLARDLAGSMAEWTLDVYGNYPATCNDCANLTNGSGHVARGGSWRSPWDKSGQSWTVPQLMTTNRSPTTDLSTLGIRCAGSPPSP